MQSNRESTRRSRRRKQQQHHDFETQVGQLRDERTSLLSRYSDINKKCDDASVDNRILKANIETLRIGVSLFIMHLNISFVLRFSVFKII